MWSVIGDPGRVNSFVISQQQYFCCRSFVDVLDLSISGTFLRAVALRILFVYDMVYSIYNMHWCVCTT